MCQQDSQEFKASVGPTISLSQVHYRLHLDHFPNHSNLPPLSYFRYPLNHHSATLVLLHSSSCHPPLFPFLSTFSRREEVELLNLWISSLS